MVEEEAYMEWSPYLPPCIVRQSRSDPRRGAQVERCSLFRVLFLARFLPPLLRFLFCLFFVGHDPSQGLSASRSGDQLSRSPGFPSVHTRDYDRASTRIP